MDFIRGISAVIVCCGHLRAVMFVDFADLKSASPIDRAFYFLTSLGHEAVMVFFVLSGFFVGGSVISKKLNFSFNNYLIARLSRLWTVLIPALIFTLIIDLITGAYFPSILLGENIHELSSGPDPKNGYSASLLTFFANITFLQSIHAPVFGSNGPLWSLANEFWYYITFPLAMIAFGAIKMSKFKRLFFAISLAVVFYFFTLKVFGGFIIWLFGTVVFLVYQKKIFNFGYWFTALSLCLFAVSLVASKTPVFASSMIVPSDYLVGFTFSLFLISLRNIESRAWVKKYLAKFSFWLSDISYTLYVIHFPLFLLIYGMFYKDQQVILSPSSLFQYLGWLILVLLLSRVFWMIFEKNTHIVRNFMVRTRNVIVDKLAISKAS